MTVVYETSFSRRCPVDGVSIRYRFRAEGSRMLRVEHINAAIKSLPQSGFQEKLTAQLRKKLKCRITTVGHHSGVKVTCTA